MYYHAIKRSIFASIHAPGCLLKLVRACYGDRWYLCLLLYALAKMHLKVKQFIEDCLNIWPSLVMNMYRFNVELCDSMFPCKCTVKSNHSCNSCSYNSYKQQFYHSPYSFIFFILHFFCSPYYFSYFGYFIW